MKVQQTNSVLGCSIEGKSRIKDYTISYINAEVRIH